MERGTREPTPPSVADHARDAVARGEWQQAYDLLSEADARTSLSGPELATFADVAYAAGHLDVTIEAWERAHAQAVRAGDDLAAADAAVRVAMHLLFDTALMAPVRGWVSRAERLLTGHDEASVHAWLAVVRSYERLLSGDFPGARRWAQQAVAIGVRLDPAAAALGRMAEARSLILAGGVAQGLALLNEAAVATVSGELEPLHAGVAYCELVCALQALMQYDLAEEWTAAMERWCHGRHVGSIHGRCRVHRAEILRLRGALGEAEREALLACEELRPYLRRELGWPLTELGRIRLRRGDLEGADDAFRAAHEVGWDPQPGLALVHLARGDVALAAAAVGDALEHPLDVPSKELPPNTELRRAPLLEAQVDIAVAAGRLDLARAAADDLSRIAARFESRALVAAAAHAYGHVGLAEGDPAAARRDYGSAAHLWNEIGAPYETALARLGLARAHRAEANEERAMLEFRAARATFERVGAVRLAAEAAHACGETEHDVAEDDDRHRDDLPRSTRPRQAGARGPRVVGESVFRREGDHWLLAFQGHATHLRDLKGLRYLARLLADPGREFHVLDMVASESAGDVATTVGGVADLRSVPGLLDAGPLLDARAKESYRRRLAEIDEDIEEAEAIGDHDRAARAGDERDFLVRELARAVGLGGRDRRAGSASERARASVTRAIRQAMTRIGTHHPPLAEHLGRAIHTGTFCAYRPDPRLPERWER